MRKFKNIIEYTEEIQKTPGTKKITLRALRKGLIHDMSLTVEPYVDRSGIPMGARSILSREEIESGKFIPHIAFEDHNRVMRSASMVKITDGKEFDITDPESTDAKLWGFVKYCPKVVMNVEDFNNNREAMFYIELPEDYAANYAIGDHEIKLRAFNMIADLPSTDLRHIAEMLTYPLNNKSDAVIKNWLIEIANEGRRGAERIINTIAAPDYKDALLIIKAIDRGVIHLIEGAYRFGEFFLGYTNDQVKTWMKDPKNADTVNQIELEINTESKRKPKTSK